MAHQPMSRPDPFEHSEIDEPLFALEHGPDHSDVTRIASKLADHMDGGDSADLALDLVLNEIVQQARLATTANGAAIALFRNGEMVCRATSGASAPDLGTRLNTRAGLSGACLRTKQIQRCDDSQTDPRVDSAALRDLEVRSILIVPILSAGDMVGIFEILSPRPAAFGDRDVLTLEALSRRIVRNLEHLATPPEPIAPVVAAQQVRLLPVEEEPIADIAPLAEPPIVEPPATRDYWTNVLTGVVIALALLLGWMVGYSGWQRAIASKSVAKLIPAGPARTESAAIPSKKQVVPGNAGTERGKSSTNTAPTKAVNDNGSSAGGLVVTQNGKVIFQMPPGETAASTIKAAGGADSGNTMSLAPEVAETYLLQRVEPDYPDAARPSQALGPVVLEIRVGKDGSVRQANLVSGDSLLIPAAVAAVRQWKYQPYSPEGNPQDFLTRVTINFKSP